VTGTVASIPLITASIMCKKLAEGIDALVLDVKCGKGAFMRTQKDARALALSMVRVGKAMKKGMAALITDMNQPLGRTAGNALEVLESIETLQGKGPRDLTDITLAFAEEMMIQGKVTKSRAQARRNWRRPSPTAPPSTASARWSSCRAAMCASSTTPPCCRRPASGKTYPGPRQWLRRAGGCGIHRQGLRGPGSGTHTHG
jgi:hypothetical protein